MTALSVQKEKLAVTEVARSMRLTRKRMMKIIGKCMMLIVENGWQKCKESDLSRKQKSGEKSRENLSDEKG